MARLTTQERKNLPDKDFALPGKRAYPIEDKAHARNALSRDHNATPAEQHEIEAKVHRMFPSIGKK